VDDDEEFLRFLVREWLSSRYTWRRRRPGSPREVDGRGWAFESS
jgi:hypothetical protein